MASLAPNMVGPEIDGLKRIELRWGFQDDALVTRLRVVAPVPRRGLAALLDQPTFNIKPFPHAGQPDAPVRALDRSGEVL